MDEKAISFGTSGHRGILGRSITIKHVDAIANAVADFVLENSAAPRIAIGYDPREGNSPSLAPKSYTKTLVDRLTFRGVAVDLFETYTPTPVVSWYIQHYKIDGGLILTASHNPPQYNGIKFNPSNGAPAPAEVTRMLEDRANDYYRSGLPEAEFDDSLLRRVGAATEFAAEVVEKLMTNCQVIETLDFSDLAVAVDAKYGAVAETWRAIFSRLGILNFEIIHADPASDFGGIEPNPTKFETLQSLTKAQKKIGAALSVANDPDGDRHVILDETGTLITPEEVSVILYDFLVSRKIPTLGVATTVASSQLVKVAVNRHGGKFHETAVGFKYFASYLEKGRFENKVALAVESSGGLSASFHTLEKCGFFPGVFLMLVLKLTGKTLSQLKCDIESKYGKYYFAEEEYQFDPAHKSQLVKVFRELAVDQLPVFELTATDINKMDGVKVIFKGGEWVLMRLSGTEPLARIYAESKSPELSQRLIEFAKQLLNQTRAYAPRI